MTELSGRDRLAQALTNYQCAAQELAQYKARAAQASTDEELVLTSTELSEHETEKRLGEAQKRKGVYTAKARWQERGLEPLAASLRAALSPAEQELESLIGAESQRRSGLLREQVLALVQISGDPNLLVRTELSTIVRHSKVVRDVESLRPVGYYGPGNIDHCVKKAQAVLRAFEQVQAEIGSNHGS